MPTQFVLELRNVTSLTEARFAAGELFTHIRLAPELAQGEVKAIQDIKDFLSGVKVGLELEKPGQMPPDWADYFVKDGRLIEDDEKYSLVPPGSDGDMAHCIIEIEDITKDLPLGFSHPVGLSFPSPGEYKTGYANFEPLQDLLEKARIQFGL